MAIDAIVRRIVPLVARQQWRRQMRGLQRRYHLQAVPVGTLDFGDLRRLTPISDHFGTDRGTPVDRYYIETFLATRASDITGRVLEAGDDRYIKAFGGDRVTRADVLDVRADGPNATVIADLTCADHVAADSFDCIVLTQTLQMIYDARAALGHIHRILKPGGVFLMTYSGISKICRREGRDDWGEYWHFTTQSIGRLFDETFPAAQVEIVPYGNVLSATASLFGLAAEELTSEELDYSDPDYEVLVGVRAVKAGPAASR